MGKYSKLSEKILADGADDNVRFVELCQLLGRLGFQERIKGDHHIFTRTVSMRSSICNLREARRSRTK